MLIISINIYNLFIYWFTLLFHEMHNLIQEEIQINNFIISSPDKQEYCQLIFVAVELLIRLPCNWQPISLGIGSGKLRYNNRHPFKICNKTLTFTSLGPLLSMTFNRLLSSQNLVRSWGASSLNNYPLLPDRFKLLSLRLT